MLSQNEANIGLYIHIPFCESKCPYCDFYSVRCDENLMERYTKSVIKSLDDYKSINKKADTLYLGGGTPSVLGDERLAEIIEKAKEFYLTDNAEITIECNPRRKLSETFKVLSAVGVNRISLGMQSAVDKERFSLGRKASANDAADAIELARNNNIDNISLDLMLGTPKMTIESLNKSLDFIEKMNVPHISAYMLKIEENTKFAEIEETLNLPSEDDVCDMYLHACERLEKFGIRQYEISNFAKSGYESKHNLKYWNCEEYLGIGPAAHSFLNGKRFFYPRDIKAFIDGNKPIFDDNGGDDKEQLMLGLRLTKGVSTSMFSKKAMAKAEVFAKNGFIKINNDTVSLTPKGFLVSNTIIYELSE